MNGKKNEGCTGKEIKWSYCIFFALLRLKDWYQQLLGLQTLVDTNPLWMAETLQVVVSDVVYIAREKSFNLK